jgi:hypothetical protein
MSSERTAWHPPFTGLLTERAPRWVRVLAEVPLTQEPLRVDDLIELLATTMRDLDDQGSVLRGLWRFVRVVALLEFKSVARPFRRGDLARLLAYGFIWYFAHQRGDSLTVEGQTRRATPDDVTLVLVVPTISPTLRSELEELGLSATLATSGYFTVKGTSFTVVLVDLAAAGDAEHDDLMQWFADVRRRPSVESRRWIGQHTGMGSSTNATPDLEGYDQWLTSFLQSLSPEQRLAGIDTDQIRALLSPEQIAQTLATRSESEQVLSLPDHLLRALSPDYLASLPAETQAAVRVRLAR